jgi:hypothetical protein
LTLTGLPEDCIFIGNLDVRKESTLENLKDLIVQMPYFN